jgi:glycosyltransferase involved in cell wall biosynthesis
VSRVARVLLLIKGLDAGGAEVLLAELLAHGSAERVHYEVAYVRAGMDALAPRIAAYAPVHCLGARSDTDLSWTARLRALLLAADRPFDVVHAHLASSAALGRLTVRSLPRSRRPRLVYTEHSSWPRLDVRTRALARLSAPLDDVSFAVSAANRGLLPKGLRRRTRVLHHGIDLTRHRHADSAVRSEVGIRDDHQLWLTVASLTAQKDYPTLLTAVGRLRDLPVTVVAAGSGPLEAALRAEHDRLGLGDRFRFLGHRSDVRALLDAADGFVLGSAWESMPVAVMEALAAGLPIVATAVGELPHVLSDGRDALLVPPRSAHALADAVRRAVTDAPLRSRLGEGALRTSSRFDIRRTVDVLESTYVGLAS